MSKSYRNWYRWPKERRENQTIACPRCGDSRSVAPGEKFHNHCASWPTEAEAREWAPKIYGMCEYLGAFEEGKSP